VQGSEVEGRELRGREGGEKREKIWKGEGSGGDPHVYL